MASLSAVSVTRKKETAWCITIDAIGAFQHNVPSLTTKAPPGNYRVTSGDSVTLDLLAGSLVNQKDVVLIVIDATGAQSKIIGRSDQFGSQKFEWKAGAAGPAVLWFEFTSFSSGAREKAVENRVIVLPCLKIGNREIDLSSVSMQTVMSRCLGRMDTWLEKIKYSTADLNYNFIHFTPVQLPGESGSCYSLAEQLKVSDELLPREFEGTKEEEFEFLRCIIKDLEVKHGVLSTSDVVLNHTANNTHWLADHPEAGYCELNSPHLTAAIELDNALQALSLDIAAGNYRNYGVLESIEDEHTLGNLRRLVEQKVLKPFRMAEWFQVDFEKSVADYERAFASLTPQSFSDNPRSHLLSECLRFVGVARCHGVVPRGEVTCRLFRTTSDFQGCLRDVQNELFSKANDTNQGILSAIEGLVRWERIQNRKGPIGTTHWNAFVPRYFTPVVLDDGRTVHLANNGWVMGWDAEEDFAAPGSLTYLNRSVVAWSDCVKLRFGEKPEDCPFLWQLMKEYCCITARIFHGIRLDNCHSTPKHVALYCLQAARAANPNLFVYAELFTGKRETDLKFERDLGIHALIREALQSYNIRDFCHHIEEFGGNRLGTLELLPALNRLNVTGEEMKIPLQLTPSLSIFFDCTHDNETPQQRRMYYHYGPQASAVNKEAGARLLPKFVTSMMPNASRLGVKGSWDGWQNLIPLSHSCGLWSADLPSQFVPPESMSWEYQYKFIGNGDHWFYDPQLPHSRDSHGHVNNILSDEKGRIASRRASLADSTTWSYGQPLPGLMEARKHLNEIHVYLGDNGFTECETKTYGDNLIVITRHQPKTHRLCIFFVHSAFSPGVVANPGHLDVCHGIRGKLDEILLEATLSVPEDVFFKDQPNYINGLASALQVAGKVDKGKSRCQLDTFVSRYDDTSDTTFITLTAFPPGSVLILTTRGFAHVRETVNNAMQDICSISQGLPGGKITRNDELQAYSYLLYSCVNEERDRSKGTRGPYDLGHWAGELAYAGIAGCIPHLDFIRYSRNLDHPLTKNIFCGDWIFEYLADRLDTDRDETFSEGIVIVLLKVSAWLRETFREPLRYLPRHLLTYYFDWIISSLYSWVSARLMSSAPEPLRNSDDPFIQRLCLATLQMYSLVPSSPLIAGTNHASLCAGLPHFSSNYMRNWGRDTFIALPGCLIVTGRYQEAREEILGFARVMRHGLIPNLLDSGNNPRYNARDATWFFLVSIQEYCIHSPEGLDFLNCPVTLKYANNVPAGVCIVTIADLVHYILSAHAKGIQFREWNAGPALDSCMKDEGFNITIFTDHTTGLVHGGSKFNCGTWMDKMGSSHEARTIGIPATPRDGAAIEINAMVISILRFLMTTASSVFKHQMADEQSGFTYKMWYELLQSNFDKCFFVEEAEAKSEVSVYKDTVNSSAKADKQLRPNVCVALAVSPEIFPIKKALASLDQISKRLFGAKTVDELLRVLQQAIRGSGPEALDVETWFEKSKIKPLFTSQLGLKTLDTADPTYRPNYDNDDRSADPSISAGMAYHNGPEWIWPVGYFLEASFLFEKYRNKTTTASHNTFINCSTEPDLEVVQAARFHAMSYLLFHRQFIATDKWSSLPELTNNNGMFCKFSCPAQAWSIGTILAFLAAVASPAPVHSTTNAGGMSETPLKAPTPPAVLQTARQTGAEPVLKSQHSGNQKKSVRKQFV